MRDECAVSGGVGGGGRGSAKTNVIGDSRTRIDVNAATQNTTVRAIGRSVGIGVRVNHARAASTAYK